MLAKHTMNMLGSDNQARFLMAEDNPADAELFTEMVYKAFVGKHVVVCVNTFKKVAHELTHRDYDALLLDLDLPDQSGVDNIAFIAEHFPSVPIIVLTGNDDFELALDSLHQGAQDYLSKNKVTPEMLARSFHYAKERKAIEEKLKEALDDAAQKNTQLEAQAKHDSLTGIANRSYFQDVSEHIIHSADRKNKKCALLYFDLDGFKKVNDTYGHLAGDELLKQVAERLRHVVRDSDFLARIGGDEFVVITDLLESKRDIYPLAGRIQQQFDKPFRIGINELSISTSIGIAFYPDADSLDLLIKQADCAMYEAKKNPKSSTCFYSSKIAAQFARAQRIESSLGNAIENDEISTNFQPIISVHNPNHVHFEALARWHCDSLGNIRPDEFIPIAENTPAINGITKCVTRYASKFFEVMSEQSFEVGRISINVSATQLANPNFVDLFGSWLKELHVLPEQICLELTERQVVQNIDLCKKQFSRLRDMGVHLALDDFGSGFSSVTHLLELPFDVLKLDRSLMDTIDQNNRHEALVAGIVEMAHRLDMVVVAEGIETMREQRVAIDLGCDYLQGYFISKPLPLQESAIFLSSYFGKV